MVNPLIQLIEMTLNIVIQHLKTQTNKSREYVTVVTTNLRRLLWLNTSNVPALLAEASDEAGWSANGQTGK